MLSRPRRRPAVLFALVAALAAAAPAPAAAQEGPSKAAREEAANRFRKGLELYNEADYQAALAEFRRAYSLAPNYAVLYNIGQVHFQMQDYPGALAAFEKYLAEGGKQVPAARRQDVERDIAKLRSRVAHFEITANVDGAEITIDDVPVGKTPLPKPVMVSAGRHRIVATLQGRTSAARVVEIASGDTADVKLELQEQGGGSQTTAPVPGPGPTGSAGGGEVPNPQTGGDVVTSPTPEEGSGPSVPWIGWGITGALAAGATVCGVLALSASSDLEDQKKEASTRDQLDDPGDRAKGLALATDILVGAAVIAGGVSLYFTVKAVSASSTGTKSSETRVVVAPRGVRLIGSF